MPVVKVERSPAEVVIDSGRTFRVLAGRLQYSRAFYIEMQVFTASGRCKWVCFTSERPFIQTGKEG